MTPEQSISDGVQRDGFRVLAINDHRPPFAYTVGLMFTFQHPELIIFGLQKDGANILRLMAKLIGGGQRFDVDGEYDLLPDLKVGLRIVDPTQHEFYLGYAMGYCREQGRPGELQAVQVYWPDKNQLFPYQRECDEQVWAAQPRLSQRLGPLDLQDKRSSRGR